MPNMFAISQHQHAYAAAQREPAHYSDHGTIRASGNSVYPDEDWTKISDLTERRRIQNRISQRNYRKKLKDRLNQKAGISDDASSSGNENPSLPTETKRTRTPKAKRQSPPSRVRPTLQDQYAPPVHHEYPFQASYDGCGWSNTPPIFAYPAYLCPPEGMIMPSDGAVRGYQPMPTETYPECLSVHFSDVIKPETAYLGGPMDEGMPPFVSYSGYPIPGVDLGAVQPFPDDQMPHTPPLSHSCDYSTASSDSGSYNTYSTMPLSMPGSPGVVRHA